MAEDSETKHGGNRNGKKEGLSGSSFFTWFMVIALLGVWTSVAVVWFELVDYEEVLAKAKDFRYNLSEVLQGKLGIYDADGDGDFDVEDAKVLLGLKERSVPAQPTPAESEESIQPVEQSFVMPEHKNVEAELREEIQSLLHDAVHSQPGEMHEEDTVEELNDEQQEKEEVHEDDFGIPTTDDLYAAVEDEVPHVSETPEPVQEGTAGHDQVEEHGVGEPETVDIPDQYEHYMDIEEPEVPDETELLLEDALEHHEEPKYGEETETQDTVYAELETGKTEETAEPHLMNEAVGKEDEWTLPEPVNEDREPDEIPEDLESNKKQSEEEEKHTEGTVTEEEEKHTEDTVAAEPQETDVPIEAENYSHDDLVDT